MTDNLILIIGASSDIGLDLIEHITEDAVILAHYNSSNDKLLELAKKIDNELVTVQADLSNEAELYGLIDKIEQEYGVPSKIIHLAAPKFENIRFKDIVWDKFQTEIDISLKSITLLLTRFLPQMAKRKQGKVVLMLSSVVVNVPPKALVQYTTIKYALLGLVKSLASEYAGKNVQINAVSPSMVETKFLDNINEKLVEMTAFNHPLKRNAHINEITPIIKTLISEDSDYITGINIPITGGASF